jgi:hypothetical protein
LVKSTKSGIFVKHLKSKNVMKKVIAFIFGAVLFQTIFYIFIRPKDVPQTSQTECKADSLQSVIDGLQGEYEARNRVRDEEVETLKILVGKYEFGLSGLDKANRKEFIRHAMFSEDYSEKVNEDYFEENRKLKQKAGYANYQ